MTDYVPAVDHDGLAMWRDELGYARGLPGGEPGFDGWRRLYVLAEPAAVEHSDMCEDLRRDTSHLRDSVVGPACRCACAKCADDDGYCICPQCSRPSTHDHRPVTS